MRSLLALLVLFLTACSPWQLAGSPHSVDTVAMLNEQTVILYEDDALHCAGVLIGPHTILTANHCIRHAGMDTELLQACRMTDDSWPGCSDWEPLGGTTMYRSMDMPKALGAKVVRHDRNTDIAILDTGSTVAPTWASVSVASDVEAGQGVHVVGHPRGIEWTYVHGYVASAHRPYAMFDGEVDWMQLNTLIAPGNSGGGAFNEDGRLIGICSWQFTTAQAAFFVPLRTIQDFTRGRVR